MTLFGLIHNIERNVAALPRSFFQFLLHLAAGSPTSPPIHFWCQIRAVGHPTKACNTSPCFKEHMVTCLILNSPFTVKGLQIYPPQQYLNL